MQRHQTNAALASKRFAIDIGGTFTDLVVMDDRGNLRMAKASSTPADPSAGVIDVASKAHLTLFEPEFFIHGTTLGINTLLQRKGVKTGLITTDGFRDILEIGRTSWPLYMLSYEKPQPLVPRYLRFQVPERMSAKGEVLLSLDESAVRSAVQVLKSHQVRAIAVCFLHAYANPAHERRVAEIIRELYPEARISLSHEVTQEYREYERTATTVLNAYLQPVMEEYLGKLASHLATNGFKGQFFITRCDGGLMSQKATMRRSLQTVHSGPASGVMGAATFGKLLGFKNVISADMGGTSFDAALIVDGQPFVESLSKIEEIPMLIPSISVATIGAGGGSIARVDSGGALQVGPESAGAQPGPICYGRGGTEPTFTDAALCNKFIDPAYFLGGEIRLDTATATKAIADKIAAPLGMNIGQASRGIMTILETKMAGVLHEICIGQGHDPRDFVIVAYGGSGPLTAASLADKIGIPKVIVPQAPANFSAWGMLMLDVVHDFSKTYITRLDDGAISTALEELKKLKSEAVKALLKEGVKQADIGILAYFDLRYEMQEHTVPVPVPSPSTRQLVTALKRAFEALHETAYGYKLPYDVEIVNIRVRGVGSMTKPELKRLRQRSKKKLEVKSYRNVWFTEASAPVKATVYERSSLSVGDKVSGPALVEEQTSITVVNPGQRLSVDGYGNLIIDI